MTTGNISGAWFDALLACPDCQGDLAWAAEGARCGCGFEARPGSPRDLRPQHPRERVQTFAIGTNVRDELARIDVERPRITYGGPAAIRDSRELFSAVAPLLREGAHFLDLGCGPRDQAAPAAHSGLRYVGIDFDSSAADVLGDGHALPFRAASFDAILSYAVLEHLYNPFVALTEVARVLRPGGVFFGTVSQGEPFHDSYFHHTAWGVLAAFRAAGLEVRRLWPSYDTLHALSGMGRYHRVHRVFIELVHRFGLATPFLAPRKYFRWTKREKQIDELHRAASVCFVAHR